jgi:hypothetical protein
MLTSHVHTTQHATVWFCRQVFGKAMPIHLCTYHVVTAWHKAICQKRVTEPGVPPKHTIHVIFKDTHAVMQHPGADTLEESRAAVRAKMAEFKRKWQHQEAIVQYFEKEWEGNIGAILPCW